MTDRSKYSMMFGGNTFDFDDLLSTLSKVASHIEAYSKYSTSGLPSLLPKCECALLTLWSSDAENGEYQNDKRIIKRDGVPLNDETIFSITLKALVYHLYEKSPGSKIIGNIKIGPLIVVFSFDYDGKVFKVNVKQSMEELCSPILKYTTKNELCSVPEVLVYKAMNDLLNAYAEIYEYNAKGAFKALSTTRQNFQVGSGGIFSYNTEVTEHEEVTDLLFDFMTDLRSGFMSAAIHTEHKDGGQITLILQRDNVVVTKSTFTYTDGEWVLNDHH